MDPKPARNALLQFALWGLSLVVIGTWIAVTTWPHADALGRYTGDEAGFVFGLVIAWLGTLLLLVPIVAWGAKLGHQAWPAPPDARNGFAVREGERGVAAGS